MLSTSCELRVDSAKFELVYLKCELRVRKKNFLISIFLSQTTGIFWKGFCKTRDFKESFDVHQIGIHKLA